MALEVFIRGGAKVDGLGVKRLHGAFRPWEDPIPAETDHRLEGIRGKDLFDEPPARFGRMDLLSKLTLGCAFHALSDTSEPASPAPVEGIILGSWAGCLMTDLNYYLPVCDKGISEAGPSLFSYTLPNVALGEVCKELGLTGPNTVVSMGRASAVAALVTAFHWIRSGRAECLLAGGAEAVDGNVRKYLRLPIGSDVESGAFFLVLDGGKSTDPGIRIASGAAGFQSRKQARLRQGGAGSGIDELWRSLESGFQGRLEVNAVTDEGFTAELTLISELSDG